MNIMIEYETECALDFDYETVIRRVILCALDTYECPYDTEVSVTLTDDASIRKVNATYRDIDRATDVLSFPMVEYSRPAQFDDIERLDDVFNPDTGCLMLGDIMISVERVLAQADAYGHSPIRELAFLTAHSMLHLFGYDHMTETELQEMERRQEELLQSLGYTRD
jgi:probable rRNA maturation factor